MIGTIIQGTYRNQDLIPALIEEFRTADEEKFQAWERWTHSLLTDGTSRHAAAASDLLSDRDNPSDDNPWWDSEEATELLDDLFDRLDDLAPEGAYFGAHVGDGADFGYWWNDTVDAIWD